MAGSKIRTKVRTNQTQMNKTIDKIGEELLDDLWKSMEKVQRRSRDVYKRHTVGLNRISKFLSTRRQKEEKNVSLFLNVDAAKGKSVGADLEGKSVSTWNDIAHQTEYGVTRKGMARIVSKGKLMSIPIHEKAKGKSPLDFPHGKWVTADNGTPYFVVPNRGGFRNIRTRRSRQRPIRERKATEASPSVAGRFSQNSKWMYLFVGKRSVAVRGATPYFRPTIEAVFGEKGEMNRILLEQIGIDFKVTRIR